MKNFLSRFFLVAVALPLLYAIVVYLPDYGHGAVVAVALVFSAGCGSELAGFFTRRGVKASAPLFAALSAFPPALLWTAQRAFPQDSPAVLGVFVAGYGIAALAAFLPFAFPSSPGETAEALASAAARAFPLVYPGLFALAIVLIAGHRGATQLILWFAMLVFGNDSAAWAVGMLFGRHRGVVSVSPNKSLEGFVGAYAGSLAAAFLGPLAFPAVLAGAPWKLAVLGLAVGTAVISGDLFESALKRSSGIKDSGAAIPGRGGFLDTFDSLLFAAPVFYAAIFLLGLA